MGFSVTTTGRVIRFDEVRGYGFVSPDLGGDDLFVHVNDLDIDKRLVVPGVAVEFIAEEGDRGLKATQLRLRSQDRATGATGPTGPTGAQPQAGETDRAETGPAVDPELLCDVLTAEQLTSELTESLLTTVPTLTAQQILAVRKCVVTLAASHFWTDDS